MTKNDRISLKEAAALIATGIYPHDSLRQADDKARKRIAYAIKQRQLSRGSLGDFSASEFTGWVAEKWPQLQGRPGVPRNPIAVGPTKIRASGYAPVVAQLPSDISSMRELLLVEIQLRHDCQERLERALQELEKYRVLEKEQRGKKAATRAKLSRAGKLGGRGRAM